MKIRISGLIKDSIVDGPGLRYVIFTQGCLLNCPGCHNVATHDLKGGRLVDIKEIIEEIKNQTAIRGVTFSGGEPFLQVEPLIEIAKVVKQMNLDLIIYTGNYFENLKENQQSLELLKYADYLVDGPYLIAKKSLNNKFKGSSNQRIINIAQSLKKDKVVKAIL